MVSSIITNFVKVDAQLVPTVGLTETLPGHGLPILRSLGIKTILKSSTPLRGATTKSMRYFQLCY